MCTFDDGQGNGDWLNLEVYKAQERLDFMRAITRGFTDGPWQSESEGENVYISSLA